MLFIRCSVFKLGAYNYHLAEGVHLHWDVCLPIGRGCEVTLSHQTEYLQGQAREK